MIKTLVVEDSQVIQQLLVYILSSSPELKVVGTASEGESAIEATRRYKPDVIVMDIHMPVMDGFEATRRIMETQPTPIVIVSGSSTQSEISTTFRALEAGALTVIPKPLGIGHPSFEADAQTLIETVKLMSEVKVVRRFARYREQAPQSVDLKVKPVHAPIRLVAIGASTGGPLAIQTILSLLPGQFPVPVLIVQHISPGFVDGFAEWLSRTTGFPVHIAASGYIQPGHAYIAPDGNNMNVIGASQIAVSKVDTGSGHGTSIAYLFRSVAQVAGNSTVAVLLSGMGRDGAEELKLIKDRGGITIVQDEATSVVFGMPAEAIKLDAASYVLPPEKIAIALTSLVVK